MNEIPTPIKTAYVDLLNALSAMQDSPAYAVRRDILREAEAAIVALERELAQARYETARKCAEDLKERVRLLRIEAAGNEARGFNRTSHDLRQRADEVSDCERELRAYAESVKPVAVASTTTASKER